MTKTREDYGSSIARPMIDEKAGFELKEQFLKELRNNAFSRTNREDAVKHIEKFLKIVDSLNVPNVTHDQLRLYVFPISLTRAASKWLNDKPYGSITTLNSLWDYWKMGDDEEVLANEKLSDLKEGNLCEGKELINTDVLTKDIPGFKTYEEYKDEWIYEWIKGIPWDYKWYKALEDIDLKDETLYNKAILEGSMKEDEELSYDSPIDEWEDFEMNNDDTIQDRKELMDNDNDDIGDLDDYLIRKDAPYYANEEEER
ncbi:hypothetical protein Tco_0625533 [Tanacetum coccineum]|uniref:Uncharacterized protein n=1 Tax=Tanacetum coccineum TaxID=301880 RepID=A0ABQ4WH31_9ASTR